MLFYLVALLICSAGATKFHRVPQSDGSWRLMTDVEVANAETEAPFYDPQTDIKFHLWTPSNPTQSQVVPLYDTAALRNSNFNPAYKTIIAIHGWNGAVGDGTIQGGRREYMAKGNYNFIGVDWSAGAQTANYASARLRVPNTGRAVADYIYFLTANAGANPRDVLVVGHSLGGQMVGFVGRHVQTLVGIKLPAIISLDPAGPLFDWDSPMERINSDDADYVNVVHTDGGNLGLHKPMGDADFYPHGGKSQAGCGVDPAGGCAHGRAPAYWIESIRGTVQFMATKCASYDKVTKEGCDFLSEKKAMFSEPEVYGQGIFWLDTNSKSPYAQG